MCLSGRGFSRPWVPDPAVITRLHQELTEVPRLPELRKKFDEAGVTLLGLGPKEFAAFLKAEEAKFSAVVARGRIQAD
jgi:tripartite-type tricarboxylate transporter receptor subunit TctC